MSDQPINHSKQDYPFSSELENQDYLDQENQVCHPAPLTTQQCLIPDDQSSNFHKISNTAVEFRKKIFSAGRIAGQMFRSFAQVKAELVSKIRQVPVVAARLSPDLVSDRDYVPFSAMSLPDGDVEVSFGGYHDNEKLMSVPLSGGERYVFRGNNVRRLSMTGSSEQFLGTIESAALNFIEQRRPVATKSKQDSAKPVEVKKILVGQHAPVPQSSPSFQHTFAPVYVAPVQTVALIEPQPGLHSDQKSDPAIELVVEAKPDILAGELKKAAEFPVQEIVTELMVAKAEAKVSVAETFNEPSLKIIFTPANESEPVDESESQLVYESEINSDFLVKPLELTGAGSAELFFTTSSLPKVQVAASTESFDSHLGNNFVPVLKLSANETAGPATIRQLRHNPIPVSSVLIRSHEIESVAVSNQKTVTLPRRASVASEPLSTEPSVMAKMFEAQQQSTAIADTKHVDHDEVAVASVQPAIQAVSAEAKNHRNVAVAALLLDNELTTVQSQSESGSHAGGDQPKNQAIDIEAINEMMAEENNVEQVFGDDLFDVIVDDSLNHATVDVMV